LVWIYRVMTREAFIEVLNGEGYSYEIKGNKIVVTDDDAVHLDALTSLTPGVVFRNDGDVHLDALTSIPPGVVFINRGFVYLDALTSLPPGVAFINRGFVHLGALTSLPPGLEFRNDGDVHLDALTSLPSGVKFRNWEHDVSLVALIGNWFSKWKGNIEGIDSKRLLNSMISKGLFER